MGNYRFYLVNREMILFGSPSASYGLMALQAGILSGLRTPCGVEYEPGTEEADRGETEQEI